MKMPGFRRIFSPDFPAESRALVDKLADSININTQVLYEAVSGKLSLRENIDCIVKDVSVQVNAAGIPINDTTVVVTDKVRSIYGLDVKNVVNLTNPSVYPTSGVTVSWQQTQGGIKILHVTGLPTGYIFSLRIVGYY